MTQTLPTIPVPSADVVRIQGVESRAQAKGREVHLGFTGDDTHLARALATGHPGAPSALFDRYGAHIERVLTNIIGFDPDLEDLVHDVFASAFQSAPRLRNHERLKAWLTSIAVNTAHKWIRSRARWRRFFTAPVDEAEVAGPNASPEITEAVRATQRVLSRLKADHRIAFSLRHISAFQLLEVAEVCDVSLATIKRRLARAERRFRILASKEPALAGWLGDQREVHHG